MPWESVVEIAHMAVVGCVCLALATFAAAVGLCVLAWWTAHRLRMRELGLCDTPADRTGEDTAVMASVDSTEAHD